jgi:hypothetical protein
MRRHLFFLVLVLVAVPLLARNRGLSIDSDGPITDCNQLRVTFSDERAPVVSEELAAASGLRALKMDARTNGGIHVTGWDQNRYSVTVCKAVGPGVSLSDIRVQLSGDEVTSSGPEDAEYVVYYIVRAPRNAVLDLRASNGPISVQETGGSLSVDTKNGPISLKDVGGTIDAQATNGPIAFAGNRGTVKLHAQNGPISVKLSGRAWEGGSFEAQTSNGPLSLKMPRAYGSGIVVESDGHGPVSCHADACRDAYNAAFDRDRRGRDSDWERPRKLEFGSGPALLHMSTSNGPISIKDME